MSETAIVRAAPSVLPINVHMMQCQISTVRAEVLLYWNM